MLRAALACPCNATLAGATERIGLGTLVLSATFREPGVLARSVETLVDAAGPRLVLGLGAGWLASEHEAFGLPFPPHAERIERLERTLDAVRGQAPDVPLLVGGASGRVLDLAVRKADLWNAPGDRLDELPALARSGCATSCWRTNEMSSRADAPFAAIRNGVSRRLIVNMPVSGSLSPFTFTAPPAARS